MIRLFANANYDFIGVRKWAYGITAAIIIPGMILLAFSGLNYSIESNGGTLVQVRCTAPTPPSAGDVRAALDAAGIRGAEIQNYGSDFDWATSSSRSTTVSSKFISSYLDVALEFYILHRPRLDLGLWLGATVHFMDFSLEAQPSALGVVRKETWFPIPALGAHFSYALLPRLYLYGKGGLFFYKVSDTEEFNSARFDISLDYYFWKALGIGATFAYQDGSVTTDRDAYRGLFKHRSSGGQIYAVIGF